MKLLFLGLAVAVLPACAVAPIQPSSERPSSAPARFDYERDDDLDDDLSRAEESVRGEKLA